MDEATRTFLLAMEQRIGTGLSERIDESQEELARMVNRGFEQTQSQHTEVMALLYRIADAVDVDMTFQWTQSEVEALDTYRREIDALTTRVKTLEEGERTIR